MAGDVGYGYCGPTIAPSIGPIGPGMQPGTPVNSSAMTIKPRMANARRDDLSRKRGGSVARTALRGKGRNHEGRRRIVA